MKSSLRKSSKGKAFAGYGELLKEIKFRIRKAQVRAAVAQWMEQPLAKMNNFVVDRNSDTGERTLRPQAVFG